MMSDIFIQKGDGRRIYGKITRDPKELASYCQPLIGHMLRSVEKVDSTWCFRFTSDITIGTEAQWRLMIKERMVITSEDDGQPFGLPEPVDAARIVMAKIGNHTIDSATISTSTGDLMIELSERAQLQLLQLSSGYEAWQIWVRWAKADDSLVSETETLCMGGGDIAHYPRD